MEPGHISIADALFTKAQQRVLALLYGQPQRSFYLNEVVRHAAMGRGAISRELDKLSMAGLITIDPRGNQVHYQANSGNPVFEELRGIVVKTFGIADVLRRALAGVLPPIHVAFVYGSVAKGTDSAGSDIDLMIAADNLTYADVISRLAVAEAELQRKINPTIYSLDEFEERRKNSSFVKRVLSQPRIELSESPEVEDAGAATR